MQPQVCGQEKRQLLARLVLGGLARFVILGSTVKHNDCYLVNNVVYDLALKGFVNPPTSTNNKPADKYLLSYYPEQSIVLSCVWYRQSTQITGLHALTHTRLRSHISVS